MVFTVHMSLPFPLSATAHPSTSSGSHLAVRLKTAADSPSVKLNLPSTSREGLESGLRKEQREQAGFTGDKIHLKGTGSPEDVENSLAGLASRLCRSLSGARQPGRLQPYPVGGFCRVFSAKKNSS